MLTAERARAYVRCPECSGTGAKHPDCRTCRGCRDLKLRRAYALGWKKDDLEIEEPGWCRCPDCGGDVCGHCMGDGERRADEVRQEVFRVLVFAKTQCVPPIKTRDHRGSLRLDHEAYLSRTQAARLRERGIINWWSSCFGDEVYLTEYGERVFDRYARRCAPKLSEAA
jgi:hypothetical protein